ncbi:MAG: lipoate--protein ligase family protein [Cyanobacteria bacterium]|nr:lipoate--protein ligase family protein [Cyanobacteria bacterium bin.51]
MAIDDWLLDQLVAGVGSPVLRLYTWARPTLSLGFHQRCVEPSWRVLQEQGRIALVRRPSGGRAVLHGGCLTYALLWPDAPRPAALAYGLATDWLRKAMEDLGQPLRFGEAAVNLQASSCFASSTAADLVDVAQGAKRVGSAQLWRQGQLLQHGSLQLAPCRQLWQEVFAADPPRLEPLPLSGAALVDHLRRSAERQLSPAGFDVLRLQSRELAAIAPRRQRFRLSPAEPASLG